MARRPQGNGAIAADQVWYAGGLRFECQPDCGGCCTDHGDHAYVYVEDADLDRLARFLGLTVDEFRTRYTTLDDGYTVLKMDEPSCPFLQDRRCSVYPVRPAQCRTFPFWKENLRSRARWERLSAFCPGVNRGKLHSIGSIRQELRSRTD